MKDTVQGFICGLIGGLAFVYLPKPQVSQNAQCIPLPKLEALSDLQTSPSREDFNRLLSAMREANLMKMPEQTKSHPPASDWLYWWPFPKEKVPTGKAN